MGVSFAGNAVDWMSARRCRAGSSPARGSGSGASLLDLKSLPAPVAEIVRTAYGDATGTIFGMAAVVAVLSLMAVLLMKEAPLRRHFSITMPRSRSTPGWAG